MLPAPLQTTIETTLNSKIKHTETLAVGFGLSGYIITLQDGRKAAVKATPLDTLSHQQSSLSLEGFMLSELKHHTNLPIPEVYYSDPNLLIMEWIEGHGSINTAVQHHAAELLAEMHSLSFPKFGYTKDSVIGPLHQPNPTQDKWIDFFIQHRLLYMAQQAHTENKLSASLLIRLEKFTNKLHSILHEPAHPSLLHGDLWTGNIIIGTDKVAGFIDPAIYCGHPEIELAFTTLFSTFSNDFFEAYQSLRPLEPGFHHERREIYNLYPLLVHVRLFGASYIPQIITVLKRHDF